MSLWVTVMWKEETGERGLSQQNHEVVFSGWKYAFPPTSWEGPPTRMLINSVLYEYGPGEVSEVCMVWEISQFAIL